MSSTLLRYAWRNLRRSPTYSIVTVVGLALGICACICIYVIVAFEFSFDAFHPDRQRIYRVINELTETTGSRTRLMVLPPAALPDGRARLTGVDALARVIRYGRSTVKAAGKQVTVNDAVITEGSWFDIFPAEWLAGDRIHALKRPYTVVLTLQQAQRYFGIESPADYLGRQLVYDDSLAVAVSGIVKDWDQPSDLAFTDFLSYPTLANPFLAANYHPHGWMPPDMTVRVWVKLANGVKPAAIDRQLAQLVHARADPGTRLSLTLQPLSAMHFDENIIENPQRTAHKPTLYGLIALALATLTLAIVNFVNLSTAYSLQRTKEVGVRKVLGSSRAGLVVKFLAELFLLIVFATGVAILLVNPVLSAFRTFLPPGVRFTLISWSTAIFLLALLLVTTLLAGLYPARIASAFLPIARLSGRDRKGGEKWILRRVLIVMQFAISLIFIMGSILIARQLRYVQHKDLGFNSDAIIRFGIPNGDSVSKVKTLEEILRKLPGVADVTREWVAPMTENGRGMRLKFAQQDMQEVGVTQVDGDEHFIPLYGIHLLAGRNLFPSDSVVEMVINESLARRIGYESPDRALGKMLYWNDKPYPVVGVVTDFHSQSMHDPISPVCIINRGEREFNLAVKLASSERDAGTMRATLTQVGKAWKQMFPGGTWTYSFYDETLAKLYENDRRTETLVNVAVGLTIFISCIGLFGLTLFTVEKRAKEISVRKVLGASIGNILSLLGAEVAWLVGIAVLVSTPVAWWLMAAWLRGFAYHVSIGISIFLLAGFAALGIALLTVSAITLQATTANPIGNLRRE